YRLAQLTFQNTNRQHDKIEIPTGLFNLLVAIPELKKVNFFNTTITEPFDFSLFPNLQELEVFYSRVPENFFDQLILPNKLKKIYLKRTSLTLNSQLEQKLKKLENSVKLDC